MLSRIVATAGIAVVATVWMSSMAVAQTPLPRTVLTIHWGSEDFPGTSVADAAIREALQSRADAPVNYYAEYLEIRRRFPAKPATLALRDYIRRKFDGRRIDVVVANTTPALQFVIRFREELFPRCADRLSRRPHTGADRTTQSCRNYRRAERRRAGRDTRPGAEAAPLGETCVRRRASADCRGLRREGTSSARQVFGAGRAHLYQGEVAAWPPCRRQGDFPASSDSVHPLHASRQRSCRLF